MTLRCAIGISLIKINIVIQVQIQGTVSLTDAKIPLQRQHLHDPRVKNPLENVTPIRM